MTFPDAALAGVTVQGINGGVLAGWAALEDWEGNCPFRLHSWK